MWSQQKHQTLPQLMQEERCEPQAGRQRVSQVTGSEVSQVTGSELEKARAGGKTYKIE